MGGFIPQFLLAGSIALVVPAQAADTVAPDSFSFSKAEFFVPKGSTKATIGVTFASGDRGWTGQVGYQTADGTAKAGADYSPAQGTLFFNGPAPKSFEVPLLPGAASAGNKSFAVHLQPGSDGAVSGANPALVHVIDNTDGVVSFASAQQQVSSSVGVATVRVVRTGSTNGSITVSYATDIYASSARYGQDYSHTTGTLTFNPGETEQTFPIEIFPSSQPGSKTVKVRLAEDFGPDFHLGNKELDLVITTSPPQLAIVHEEGLVQVSWPESGYGYVLERASDMSFSDAKTIPHVSNGTVCAASEPCGGIGFYRLK